MHPVMIKAIAAEQVRENQARVVAAGQARQARQARVAAASRTRQARGTRRRAARPRVPAQRRLQAWFSASASLRAR